MWVSEGLFVVDLLFEAFFTFSLSHPFVGSLIPGEVVITSSDPISVSTPVLPRTVLDSDGQQIRGIGVEQY